MPRLIDADALKEKILAERDAIPKTFVERYEFGVERPNHHGNAMRGGIRKALRCVEQTPTIDPSTLRPKGEWTECDWVEYDGRSECIHYPKSALRCSNCCNAFKKKLLWKRNFCPNCGADMRGNNNGC